MKLPTELFLQVLQNLPNRDLKAVRLASQEFSVCAAEFLFRKMYISKQKEDLDAFEGFTNHPLIRKCVKTLEYDAVVFPADFSETSYYEGLWYHVMSSLKFSERLKPFVSPDSQINDFVSHCRNAPGTPSTATDPQTLIEEADRYIEERDRYRAQYQEGFMEFDFIKRGYHEWMERATFERLHMQDQDFLSVLVPGLKKLDHLDSVNLEGGWRYGPDLRDDIRIREYYGSLLQRKWKPFVVRPLSWYHRYSNPSYGPTGRFWAITTALSMASKQPRVFKCESRMLPSALAITAESSGPDDGMVACGCRVFACLQHFNLHMQNYPSHWEDLHELELHEKLTGLQKMLRHMLQLRTLEFNLPWTDWRRSSFPRRPKPLMFKSFRYDLVFPKSTTWESLTTVSIGSFTMHLHEMIGLLFINVPNLRRVHLDDIRLLEGTWQAVIELFKYGLRSLEDFQIDKFTQLFHCQQMNVLVAWELQDVWGDLKNYILNGRDNLNLRHPCLQPEDPVQKSLEYLPELLRECERKGRKGSLAARVVQGQIEYSRQAYQQWEFMKSEAIVDEQA